jgi:hypothetical protein
MIRHRDPDDLYDGVFSPQVRAQIEYLEHSSEQAERAQTRARHRPRIGRAEDAAFVRKSVRRDRSAALTHPR